ncbi:MAG: lysophospholipid acyltransferase family protein [Bacteroidia bacterium]|nr:lysophospholipid acyltransferase family protein [Bacteroidia bacterium]
MTKLEYYLIYFIFWILSLLPLSLLYGLSWIIYLLIFHVIGYRKKVVFGNLRNSFPDKPEIEIHKIARKFYRHLSDLFVEIVKLMSLNKKQILKRVVFKNQELVDELFRKNRSITGIIGHYGNWEWMGCYGVITRHHLLTIYKPLSDKAFDRLMLKMRSKFGAIMVPMQKIYRELLKYDQLHEPTISIFVADQSPVKSEIHYRTSFLNQDTPIYLGPEKIAKKMNHAVIFYRVDKVRRGYYEVTPELLFDNVSGVPEDVITEAHVRALERVITERPEFWLWSHRRWKHMKD